MPHSIPLAPVTLNLPECSSLAPPDFNSSINLLNQQVSHENGSQLEEADAQDEEAALVLIALLPNDHSDMLVERCSGCAQSASGLER